MRQNYLRQIAAVAVIMYSTSAFADISGTVKSADGEPLTGATVTILALPDTTIVNAAIADFDGKFDFPQEKAKGKLLSASYLGFETVTITPQEGENRLVLSPSSTQLAEVSVTAEKGTLRGEAGKFVYIPGTMALKMPNALEALKITPLLDYDMESDSFSIVTKGESKIYINGRDPKEFPKEIMSMLRSISPKNIKKVEIITNPGAEVDGSYTGGIINIEVTLPNEGTFGSVSTYLSSSFHGFPNSNSTLYLGYHKNRFHYSMDVSFGQGGADKSHSVSKYIYGDSDTEIIQDTRGSGHSNGLQLVMNAYYDLTSRSKLGISAHTYTYEGYSRDKITSRILSPEGEETNHSSVRNVTPVKTPEARVSAYYTLNLDNRNSYFDINGYFARVLTKSFTERNFPEAITRDDKADRFRHWNLQTTLKKNFADNSTLQGGLFFHNFRMANLKDYSPSGTYNDYRIIRNSFYAYAQYSRRIGEFLSIMAGLRWEYNHHDIMIKPAMKSYRNSYNDWLPSLSISTQTRDGNHQWSLDYRRYIKAPGVSALDPTLDFSSPNIASSGNPYLTSYTNDSFSINYVLFRHFIFIPNFTTGKNYFTNPVVEGDVTINMPTIDGRSDFLGLPIIYQNDFFNIWNVRVHVTPQWYHVKSDIDPSVGFSVWTWSFYTRHKVQFIPSKPYFLTAEFSYRPRCRDGSKSFTEATTNLNLGFQGQISPKLEIFGQVNNVLNSRPATYYNSPAYSYSTKNLYSGVSIWMGFNYWFGNQKVRQEAAENRLPNL